MPLSSPAARRPIHTRSVQLQGYERDDGLWDIEARLTDTKAYGFDNRWRGHLEPGDPVHDMWLRLTVDGDFRIHDVEAVTDASPFPECPVAARAYRQLIGLQIGPGWMREVHKRIKGTAGCTHLFELLRPLATAAIQTISPMRRKERAADARPPLVDTCHGWRRDGEAIATLYPQWLATLKND